MYYFARFEEIGGQLFRFDTRAYLREYDSGSLSTCVGAIIAKNPGSAGPTRTGEFLPLNLGNDRMLPSVKNRFDAAFRRSGKSVPRNAFVRVWNLFYLCDPVFRTARKAVFSLRAPPECPTESESIPILWFAWGGDDKVLNPFKRRFLKRSAAHEFFWKLAIGGIVQRAPGVVELAKHPQGLLAEPIVKYLAGVL